MRLPTNRRVWHTLAAITLSGMLVGCGQAPRTDAPSGPASRAPASAPRVSAAPASTGAPIASLLPGGLEARPGHPLIDGEAAGCVPGCEEYGTVQRGRLPTGHYQTQWFFGGFMTVESDGSWPISEDSTAELSLVIREGPDGPDNYLIHFDLDPQLVLHGVIDPKVERTAKAYAEWLQAHPDLIVSSPAAATIGSMPALSVDIKLGPKAGQDETICGSNPCISFMKNPWIPPGFQHFDGILGDDIYRFYFADITYSGTDHLLRLWVEASDPDDLESTVSRVEALLQSATFPARRPAAPPSRSQR